MAASDVPAARTAYQQAGELARRIGSAEALARAGLGLGLGLEFTSMIVDPVQVRLLEEALAALGEADSPLRARVLAGLARALVSTPQVERRLALSEDAVQMARRLGDPAALAAALFGRHLAIWGSERAEVAGERLAIATEVVGLAEQIGDRAMALRGRGLRRIDLLELGDLVGYDADLAAAERAAEELRQLRYRWQLPLAHATRALLAGRFAQAEKLMEQGLAAGRRAGDQAVGNYYTGVIATLRLMQGRFGELIEQAWDTLVKRYAPLVWSICRRYRLSDADTHDVSQSVWLGLVNHLSKLRDPAALPGWLATTTRRECGKVWHAAQAAGYALDTGAIPDEQTGMAEQELLLAERHAALREALTRLTPSCQRMIALLTEDPPVPYAQISARLGIPVGSIGPCRSRCLDKLRRNPAIAALINTDGEPATGELPGQARHLHRLGRRRPAGSRQYRCRRGQRP